MARFRLLKEIGGYPIHAHTLADGRVVQPGGIINCNPEDLGGAIRKYEALDPEVKKGPEPKTLLTMKAHADGGGFDIISDKLKGPINTIPLDPGIASALIDYWEADDQAAFAKLLKEADIERPVEDNKMTDPKKGNKQK